MFYPMKRYTNETQHLQTNGFGSKEVKEVFRSQNAFDFLICIVVKKRKYILYFPGFDGNSWPRDKQND